MALDWSKSISFSGLRRPSSKGGTQLPEKTHMNLAVADQKTVELRRAVPVGILLLALVLAFAKFGVFDFVDHVHQKSSELSQQRAVLAGYEAQLADYDEVLSKCQSYEANDLTADGIAFSALDALKLVDETVAPMARIVAVDCEGGVISLNLGGISLDETGSLVNALYARPEVANVSVSSAATGRGAADETTVAMTITLQGAGGDGR